MYLHAIPPIHEKQALTFTSQSLPPCESIVLSPRKLHIPVLLDPLQELEVVLHLALDESIHRDGLRATEEGRNATVERSFEGEEWERTLSIPWFLKMF